MLDVAKIENNAGFNMEKILLYGVQLGVHYDEWINNDNIKPILDLEKNSFCLLIKHNNPELDDKAIKCITLAIYIYMYNDLFA